MYVNFSNMKNISIAPERGEIVREFSQKEVNEIVDGLINDSIQIEDVPSCVHSKLFTPLSLARNEAKIGNQVEKYNHLNNILWSLKLTLVQPDKSLMPQMESTSQDQKSKTITLTNQNFTSSSNFRDKYFDQKPEVSLVSAIKNDEDYSDAVAVKRLKGNIDTTREFYENEEKHLNDLRDKEYKELCKTHKMQTIPSDPKKAIRFEDKFELELVDSRNKWNEKLKKLRENKEKELSEMETELSYYDKPPQKYDSYDQDYFNQDYFNRDYNQEPQKDNLSNTVQEPQKELKNTQKRSKSPKSKTLQPNKKSKSMK